MAKIHERIKKIREESGLTQIDLAEKLCMSKGAVGNYETGERTPSFETLEAIADIFNVSMDYLCGRVSEKPQFSLEEQWVIETYRKADANTKDGLRLILKKFDEVQKVERKAKIIPLFPAAAGPRDYIDWEPDEEWETDDQKADFAVRISGDSMEPELHDGEVVLCSKRKPKDGEIAVVRVNGAVVVKQIITDSFRNTYLRSLNRARKDQDIDLLASGDFSAQGLGTVMHRKIPLVEQ